LQHPTAPHVAHDLRCTQRRPSARQRGQPSAVVGGVGEVLGLDRSLLLLAVLPLAGCLALVSIIRVERVPS